MSEIAISWMYPDILNLHGDRGNVMALERAAKIMGTQVKITRVENYEQDIDFENTDIFFFNVGEIKVVDDIVKCLKKYEKKLKQYIDENKIIVLIGTSGAIFSNSLTRLSGEVIEGLKVLDMDCFECEKIYGDDIHFQIANFMNDEINGSQIQLIETHLKSADPFGTLLYGRGNNKTDNSEGAKYKNVIYTNALGPVLVKNPWLCAKLIEIALENKGEMPEKILTDSDFDLERKSAECIKEFIRKKQK